MPVGKVDAPFGIEGWLQDTPVLRWIKAEATRADEVGYLLLTSERGADLIVMGAYGHGRLREWVFGGVTRNLLANASICCLMSH